MLSGWVATTGHSPWNFLACVSVIFVTVSFPGLWTVGIFAGVAGGTEEWHELRQWSMVIVATEIRHRRITIVSATLLLGPVCLMETFDSNLTLYVPCIVFQCVDERDATLIMNDLYYPLIGSTCFGLSPVHHQEHHLIKCITHWYVRAGETSCC